MAAAAPAGAGGLTQTPAPFKLEARPRGRGARRLGGRARSRVLARARSVPAACAVCAPANRPAIPHAAAPQRFFEKHEHSVRHLLCCSDCEPLTLSELLAHADADARARCARARARRPHRSPPRRARSPRTRPPQQPPAARWEGLKLSYTEPAGLTPLREAIATGLYGGAFDPAQLVVLAPEEGAPVRPRPRRGPGSRTLPLLRRARAARWGRGRRRRGGRGGGGGAAAGGPREAGRGGRGGGVGVSPPPPAPRPPPPAPPPTPTPHPHPPPPPPTPTPHPTPRPGIYLTMKALLRPGDVVVGAAPRPRPPARLAARVASARTPFPPRRPPTPAPPPPPPPQVCCYPAYQSLYELAAAAGCALRLWEPTLEGGAPPRFDAGALEGLIAAERPGAVRCVVVNFPHNPTGAALGAAERARVVAAAAGAGAYLFSDEMYWLSGVARGRGATNAVCVFVVAAAAAALPARPRPPLRGGRAGGAAPAASA